jgi:hypothetical protein
MVCAAMVVTQVLAKDPSVKKLLGRKFRVSLPNPPKLEPSESRSPVITNFNFRIAFKNLRGIKACEFGVMENSS